MSDIFAALVTLVWNAWSNSCPKNCALCCPAITARCCLLLKFCIFKLATVCASDWAIGNACSKIACITACPAKLEAPKPLWFNTAVAFLKLPAAQAGGFLASKSFVKVSNWPCVVAIGSKFACAAWNLSKLCSTSADLTEGPATNSSASNFLFGKLSIWTALSISEACTFFNAVALTSSVCAWTLGAVLSASTLDASLGSTLAAVAVSVTFSPVAVAPSIFSNLTSCLGSSAILTASTGAASGLFNLVLAFRSATKSVDTAAASALSGEFCAPATNWSTSLASIVSPNFSL